MFFEENPVNMSTQYHAKRQRVKFRLSSKTSASSPVDHEEDKEI